MGVLDADKAGAEQAGNSGKQFCSREIQKMCTVVAATSGLDLHSLLETFRRANCNVVNAGTVRAWFKASADLTSFVEAVKEDHRGDAPHIIPVVDSDNVEMLAKATAVDEWDFLLFHSRPEAALLHAVAEASSMSEALERWERSARSLLQIYYQNRQAASVLSYETLRRHPQSFAEHLRQRLGVDVDGLATVMDATNDGKASETLRFVAMQMVSQSGDIRKVVDELDACSPAAPSLDDAIASVDFELVCEELIQNGLHDTAWSDLAEENELLLLQLHQVQEELHRYYLELQDAVKRCSSLEKQLTGCKDKVKKRERELEKGDRELENARSKIDDFRRSTSWKITHPVRVLGRLVRKRK